MSVRLGTEDGQAAIVLVMTLVVILAVAGFGYLLGLSNYGVAEEGMPDDADAGHPVRSPVSS